MGKSWAKSKLFLLVEQFYDPLITVIVKSESHFHKTDYNPCWQTPMIAKWSKYVFVVLDDNAPTAIDRQKPFLFLPIGYARWLPKVYDPTIPRYSNMEKIGFLVFEISISKIVSSQLWHRGKPVFTSLGIPITTKRSLTWLDLFNQDGFT